MIATFLQNIRNKILECQSIQSCLIYPPPREEIIATAVFLEIANYGIGDDPATEELALVANLEARVVVDSTIADAEVACQSLACEIASLIHLNSFGCEVSPAKLSGISRDFFKPDFDMYVCWLIEWSHEFHVGSSVWKEIGIPPHTITIGEHIHD